MKDSEAVVVLPEIDYRMTTESANQIAAELKVVPDFDPSLGIKNEVNAGIIETSKYANKKVAMVEKLRKQFKDPAIIFGRAVDEKAKELKAILEPGKLRYAEARHTIDKYEQDRLQAALDAEKERVEALDVKIKDLQAIPGNAIGLDSFDLREVLENLTIPLEEDYQEKQAVALFLYAEAKEKLEGMIEQADKAAKAEDMLKEQEAKAKEAADKEAKAAAEREAELDKEREVFREEKRVFEAEKRAAQEAADMKKAEEDAKEYAAQQKAEAEETAARKRADEAAQSIADAANKALADEAAAKAAALDEKQTTERREATINYLNTVILTATDEEADPGEYLFDAITNNEVPNVKWVPNVD